MSLFCCWISWVSVAMYNFCTPTAYNLSAALVCLQLVDEAYQRWLVEEEGVVDDITAVVVKFIHAEA